MKARQIPISTLTVDRSVSARVAYSAARVRELADRVKAGDVFPPVVAYRDGPSLVLAEGFYRVAALLAAGRTAVSAEVREGDRRAAELCALQANLTHGLPRTRADKRRAVEGFLADPEWARWSDREIGRRVGVAHTTVARLRTRAQPTRLSRRSGVVREVSVPRAQRGPNTPARVAVDDLLGPVRLHVDAMPDGPARSRAVALLGSLAEVLACPDTLEAT